MTLSRCWRVTSGPISALSSTPVLIAVSLLFALSVGLTFAPSVLAKFVTFEAGDRLEWKRNDRPLGEVLQFDDAHAFEEGPALPAYRVRVAPDVEQWFPAEDLHRHCRVQ